MLARNFPPGVALYFIFGAVKQAEVHHRGANSKSGCIEFERARVRWFLSVSERDLPGGLPSGQRTFRSIMIDGDEVEFSDGFTDLHTRSYQEILAGRGFTLDDVRPSIEMVAAIRSAPLEPHAGKQHPFVAGIVRNPNLAEERRA